MRRKLDLNEPAGKLVATIGVFVLVAPLVLFAAYMLLQTVGVSAPAIQTLIMVSFALGILLAITFGGLAIAEQRQDQRYDHSYRKQKDRKIMFANDRYECQYCGNRGVIGSDRFCRLCGKNLR